MYTCIIPVIFGWSSWLSPWSWPLLLRPQTRVDRRLQTFLENKELVQLAYTNNEINSWKNQETDTWFSAVVVSLGRFDNLYICPPNIILNLFRLLAIPYSCSSTRMTTSRYFLLFVFLSMTDRLSDQVSYTLWIL